MDSYSALTNKSIVEPCSVRGRMRKGTQSNSIHNDYRTAFLKTNVACLFKGKGVKYRWVRKTRDFGSTAGCMLETKAYITEY